MGRMSQTAKQLETKHGGACRTAHEPLSAMTPLGIIILASISILTVLAPLVQAQHFHLWLEAEQFSSEAPDAPRVRTIPTDTRPTPATQVFSNDLALVLQAGRAAHSVFIPIAGQWAVWVRYVQHKGRSAPFEVRVEHDTNGQWQDAWGENPIAHSDDEMLLRFGWTCVWERHDATLRQGPARLTLSCDERSQAEIDCIMLTTDADFRPVGLEPPPFDYLQLCDEWSTDRTSIRPLVPADFSLSLGALASIEATAVATVPLKSDVLDIGLLAALARGSRRAGGAQVAFQLPPTLEQPSTRWRRKVLIALAFTRAGTLDLPQRPLPPPLAETVAWLDELDDLGEPFTPLALLVDAPDSAAFEQQNRIPPGRMLSSALKVLRYPVARAAAHPAGSESRTLVPASLGDMFDVLSITENPAALPLNAYRAIVVAGDRPLEQATLATLLARAHDGATVVFNVAHLERYPDPEQFGIVRTGVKRATSLARCTIDQAVFTGSPFEYELAAPQRSRVLFEALGGDPLAVSTPTETGQVVVVLIPYGDALDGQPSAACAHLLHHLAAGLMPLQVLRGEVQWSVNRVEGIWRVVLITPSDGPGGNQQVQLLARVPVKTSLERISGRPILWHTDGALSHAEILIGPSGIAVVDVIE